MICTQRACTQTAKEGFKTCQFHLDDQRNRRAANGASVYRAATRRAQFREMTRQLIEKLGGVCARCGERDPEVLTFDHVNGGGSRERAELGGRERLRAYLTGKRDLAELQLLCGNCHLRKSRRELSDASRKYRDEHGYVPKPRSRTGYWGVSQIAANRWQAQLSLNWTNHYLGKFDTPEEAARAFDAAVVRLGATRAHLNFPEEHGRDRPPDR